MTEGLDECLSERITVKMRRERVRVRAIGHALAAAPTAMPG